jgi:hypothetical protein
MWMAMGCRTYEVNLGKLWRRAVEQWLMAVPQVLVGERRHVSTDDLHDAGAGQWWPRQAEPLADDGRVAGGGVLHPWDV